MDIRLHIGAHKTATTYMQSKLMEEREKLAAAKTGVVFHGHFRKHVADALDAAGGFGGVGYAVARRPIARALAKMVAFHHEQDRVVMSDENVAGSMLSAIEKPGLYPDVRRRLAAVLEAMPAGSRTTVYFCVRNYAAYFSSIHAFRAGKSERQEVATFRERALNLQRGWAEVVADICEAAGAERTVVWSYEDFAKRPSQVNLALLGAEKPRVFVKTDKASLPSLSRKGLALLDRVSDMLSEKEHENLARVVARFEFDKPDEKFSLFDDAERATLAERYAQDLERIAGLGCQVVARPKPKTPGSDAEDEEVDEENEAPANEAAPVAAAV